MPIYDIFSKRQKRLRGDIPDIYTYDSIPNGLRVQIVHIWNATLGNRDQYFDGDVKLAYESIVEILCEEYGVFKLPRADEYERNFISELSNFFLHESDIEKSIDAIELSFKIITTYTRKYDYLRRHNGSKLADNAISDLNTRFKEHGVGYQFVEKEIIRTDSELLHVEAVKPALRLLNQKSYQGAQEEFLSAYEHYRHGKNKEALNDCLKAFESTMKAICDKKNWPYQATATAKPLIKVCFDNGLIPPFWESHFSSLRSTLESGIPTGRNKMAGHGQGATPVAVPDHLVAYMLHMTASTLVFLTTAEGTLP
ncbi:MAG: hypothetical protein RPU61_04755 [Candidatus Sedimenticola sp. (ex Thyasira tokunagai)]